MNAIDAIASVTQIVSSMVLAVSALEQAYKDLIEAPKRIRVMEEFVADLENLVRQSKQKHAQKLHNPQLEHRIQSLQGLTERLHLNLAKARRFISKSKTKTVAKVLWNSMVGDPILKLTQLIRDDLNWWLDFQKISDGVQEAIDSAAKKAASLLRVKFEQGYPVSRKCQFVRSLLERENAQRVVLIVGLSGIGKSCLARQIAADPPSKFVHGAAELSFGRWCSIVACNGSRSDYYKRLAKRISRLLVLIGFTKKATSDARDDLEEVCLLLQTALLAKSILVILDDVWEQDIVERFAKLYGNDCRYLVTTRNESIYEITEAEKVEICKDDIREISQEILLYHSLLSPEELPLVAESLLERCGHHPLTVAVMGKALRKETRPEKWEKAICNLSTYATYEQGPNSYVNEKFSYVNEKEAENTLTIFRSFEFSLEAMPEHCRRFFIILASIAWVDPVPESCLEALWLVLGHESVFPLVISKLVEGSLLIKLDSNMSYHVHDMVVLYLDSRTNDAIQSLRMECARAPNCAASLAPWLFIFGKESAQLVAEDMIKSLLCQLRERQVVILLESIIHALMASKSIAELEVSRRNFCRILGPRSADLISTGSQDEIVAAAKAITFIFTQQDYSDYAKSLEGIDAIDRLLNLCQDCSTASTKTILFTLIAKLAEYGNSATVNTVLASLPMHQLAELLSPDAEEWHESVFVTLMSLTKAGKSKAVEIMIASGIDQKLLMLLENGSEVAQHYAIVTLKTFYELGGPLGLCFLQPGALNMLPWHIRFSLERFVISDKSIHVSPKPQSFHDLLHQILGSDGKTVVEAIQDLIPIIEKAGDARIQDMILESKLLERIAYLLQHGDTIHNRVRSLSAFLVMKLACTGDEPLVRKFIELDIDVELVKMMQCNNEEVQDSAYAALHQIVFGRGGTLVLDRFLHTGLLEKVVTALDRKLSKTKEVCMLLLLDLVEVGGKPCIEKLFSAQVIERLVSLEKIGGKFSGAVLKFLKGLDMCKTLSAAERRVMKQQTTRKVRAAVKGHDLQTSLIALVEAYVSEGSRGASSSRYRR